MVQPRRILGRRRSCTAKARVLSQTGVGATVRSRVSTDGRGSSKGPQRMGAGAGACSSSVRKKKVLPLVDGVEFDVSALVGPPQLNAFPPPPAEERQEDASELFGPQGAPGDCLLFMESVLYSKGQLSVRAAVAPLSPRTTTDSDPVDREQSYPSRAHGRDFTSDSEVVGDRSTSPTSPRRMVSPRSPRVADIGRALWMAAGMGTFHQLPTPAPAEEPAANSRVNADEQSTTSIRHLQLPPLNVDSDEDVGSCSADPTPMGSQLGSDCSEVMDTDGCWPRKQCVGKVSWQSARSLGIGFRDRARYALTIEIRNGTVLLGTYQEPMRNLPVHQTIFREVALASSRRNLASRTVGKVLSTDAEINLGISFQIVNAEVVNHPRTVYFVRHAESKWNDAQSKAHVHRMVTDTDHGLSTEGRRQAEALSKILVGRVPPGKGSGPCTEFEELAHADIVYVSPLVRAVQTAIVGLGPALTAEGRKGKMVLVPNAREKQNLGGMDTISTKKGVQILTAAKTKLNALYRTDQGGFDEITNALKRLSFDISATEEQWWSEQNAESRCRVAARMDDFMAQLMYSPHRTIVVVGHSLFLKNFMAKYLSTSFTEKNPAFARQLGSSKLSNCGVLRCVIDPSENFEGKPIVDARLVLGSELTKPSKSR